MRTLLYTLIFTLALVSCKSIETMVEKGEYEKAFSHAVDKLAGEKNKKTKYVKGLEKAYIELNSKDLKKLLRWKGAPQFRSGKKSTTFTAE
jgi:hypothetical protein